MVQYFPCRNTDYIRSNNSALYKAVYFLTCGNYATIGPINYVSKILRIIATFLKPSKEGELWWRDQFSLWQMNKGYARDLGGMNEEAFLVFIH